MSYYLHVLTTGIPTIKDKRRLWSGSALLTRRCGWAAAPRSLSGSSGRSEGLWTRPEAPGCSTWRWTPGCAHRSPGTSKGSAPGSSPCGGVGWVAPNHDSLTWPEHRSRDFLMPFIFVLNISSYRSWMIFRLTVCLFFNPRRLPQRYVVRSGYISSQLMHHSCLYYIYSVTIVHTPLMT